MSTNAQTNFTVPSKSPHHSVARSAHTHTLLTLPLLKFLGSGLEEQTVLPYYFLTGNLMPLDLGKVTQELPPTTKDLSLYQQARDQNKETLSEAHNFLIHCDTAQQHTAIAVGGGK